ncbi:MAG TPA: DNA-3-methyladenine glycosylase [Vicinamibacterales bacterium]
MAIRRSFYDRPTLAVAADLIGKVLVHRAPEGTSSGAIVEAEAYIGENDPACHAAPGPTARNQPLYGPPGHAYVYLNYGIHFLFNVVTEGDGRPAAVLVRALQPIDGLDLMQRRRAPDRRGAVIPHDELCRGPGNVARAMGITLAHNRTDLCGRTIYLEDRGLVVEEIAWGPRIGISVGIDRPWRCYVPSHPAVSGRK